MVHKEEFINFLSQYGDVLSEAEKVAQGQVEYWSLTLKSLRGVHRSSKSWTSKSTSKVLAKKLMSEWKTVGENYDRCYEAVRGVV